MCTSILNVRPIFYALIMKLNSQEKIDRIAGKNPKDLIIDPRVDQFYALICFKGASEVKIWH